MVTMNTKILATIAIILILTSLAVPFISAERVLVWTEYSDSTSTRFTITEPSQPPITPPTDDNRDNPKCHPFNPIDLEPIEPTYSDWTCINNQLQREVTQNDLTEIEYGGVCGLELNASEKPTNSNNWILYLMVTFVILIILLIIAILLIRRQ